MKEVGRELGVRYVLEGVCAGQQTVCVLQPNLSMRRLVGILGQTVSDGTPEDIFDLQDQ